jgi:tetratricopeptide (TPR) repeat protein
VAPAAPAPDGPTGAVAQAQPAEVAPAPPRNADAEYRRLFASAERKYEQGRFEEAIAEYRRAAAIHGGAEVQVNLARAYYDAGRTPEALRAVALALQQDQGHAPAWLLLGEMHQAAHEVEQARNAYQQFLVLQPKGEQARAVREILAKQLK